MIIETAVEAVDGVVGFEVGGGIPRTSSSRISPLRRFSLALETVIVKGKVETWAARDLRSGNRENEINSHCKLI